MKDPWYMQGWLIPVYGLTALIVGYVLGLITPAGLWG